MSRTLRPNAGLRAAGHLRGPRNCFARVSVCFRNQPLLVRVFTSPSASAHYPLPSCVSHRLALHHIRIRVASATALRCTISASELRQPPPCVASFDRYISWVSELRAHFDHHAVTSDRPFSEIQVVGQENQYHEGCTPMVE